MTKAKPKGKKKGKEEEAVVPPVATPPVLG